MHTDVRIERAGIEWLVMLNERVVQRFDLVGEALDFVSLLECDPRFRAAAIPA